MSSGQFKAIKVIFIFIIYINTMTWPTLFDTKLDEFDAMDLPGHQLAATHADTQLAHLLNLDINAPAACQRLTGIMASIGPSTCDVESIEKLMAAGMNIAQLNMTYGLREQHIQSIKRIREAAANFSITMGRTYPIAIAVRLSGRKIRTGCIAECYGDAVELQVGQVVRLTSDETYRDRCSGYAIYVDFINLADQLSRGTSILLDNETIALRVEIISSSTLTCRVERGGLLGSYKDVFIPRVVLNMANYSDNDLVDIEMAKEHQVEIIITSFVNSPESVEELRNLLGKEGRQIAIISNIQTMEGYRNFESVLKLSDGIMITRQELGADLTPKKLVTAQKNMIAQANQANIPIFINAHLLSSMMQKTVPFRADLLDIANCVLDGADGLVLGPETAIGKYPIQTVECMASTCKEAECCLWSKQILSDFIGMTPLPCDQTTGIAISAVLAAQRCMASAIIALTSYGRAPHIAAKYRPRCPIIAVTRYPMLAKQMHMWRGIMPLIYEDPPEPDFLRDVEKRCDYAVKWAMTRGFVRVGDPLVTLSGWMQGAGYTNTMRIVYASLESTSFA